MSAISATALDLLTFFEVEPTLLDPNDPWPYTDAAYSVSQGVFDLSFAVAPAYKDVRIVLKVGGAALYELTALGVVDVKYHEDNGRESLEVVTSESDRLFLRLKPTISLSHECKRGS